MVSLPLIKASNALTHTTLPSSLIAIFTGATSGIGEITLKYFARDTASPKCYLIGRSQSAADRIIADCKIINPGGEYVFLKADLSLLANVDVLCEEIKRREARLDLLFLCAGEMDLERQVTEEGLHLLTVLSYYSRIRMINLLLPLLTSSTSTPLHRIVFVGGGSYEGTIYPDDFQALHLSLFKLRGHLSTMITLALEHIALTAPTVTFVHNHPGSIKTPLFGRIKGRKGVVIRGALAVLGRWVFIGIEECGERHVWFCTSGRFRPREGGREGFTVPTGDEEGIAGDFEGFEVAKGTDGVLGSGVYSVDYRGEVSNAGLEVLRRYRDGGMGERVWKHTEKVFAMIVRDDDEGD